jgi:hypothetical protein
MDCEGAFEPDHALPWNEQDLVQDLELRTLFDAMAEGDEFLRKVVHHTLLAPLTDPAAIRFRQDVLRDCLAQEELVREIYAIAVEAIEAEKKAYWGIYSKYPRVILSRSVEVIGLFMKALTRLRRIADAHAARFSSDGFRAFFAMLQRSLDDKYLAEVQQHLRALKLGDGTLISARLGSGAKGRDYTLRKPNPPEGSWFQRLFAGRAAAHTFQLAPRDESGARALAELEGRGIAQAANALAQSGDHILGFFVQLRAELAFYLGCLNLHRRLVALGEPLCMPEPAAATERRHRFSGLYDVCLALTTGQRVVGNDVEADGRMLIVVTGANRGGKSTFLRSLGLAQLMMQAGMTAPAESFCANVCSSICTHYKREEDVTLRSGKLDEELGRMSRIVDHLAPDALVLFNESFAATNEREGSEIARRIVEALCERRIKVAFVTHLHTLARGLYERSRPDALFLRAERRSDGTRTFRMTVGEPLQTTFADDLYRRIFEGRDAPQTSPG